MLFNDYDYSDEDVEEIQVVYQSVSVIILYCTCSDTV